MFSLFFREIIYAELWQYKLIWVVVAYNICRIIWAIILMTCLNVALAFYKEGDGYCWHDRYFSPCCLSTMMIVFYSWSQKTGLHHHPYCSVGSNISDMSWRVVFLVIFKENCIICSNEVYVRFFMLLLQLCSYQTALIQNKISNLSSILVSKFHSL